MKHKYRHLPIISFFSLCFLLAAGADARVLVKQGNTLSTASDEDPDSGNPVIHEHVKEATNGMDLRKIRRVAVGIQAAGVLGLGGALLELNLDRNWGVVSGFGGGEGFQAFDIGAKYVFGGEALLPYTSFEYARWSSVGKTGYINRTNPSILSDRLLTEDERQAGEYQKNLLVPSLGLQYLQLNGDWAGASIFVEINILLDLGALVAAPTGTLGVSYYF